ncbi:MAG: hypothetical protein C4299_02660 [Thermoleophilia bacterium]
MPPGVEGEKAKAVLSEAVAHEAEVVSPKQAASELEDDWPVLEPAQLVVQADAVLDLNVGHELPSSPRIAVLLDRRRKSDL